MPSPAFGASAVVVIDCSVMTRRAVRALSVASGFFKRGLRRSRLVGAAARRRSLCAGRSQQGSSALGAAPLQHAPPGATFERGVAHARLRKNQPDIISGGLVTGEMRRD